MRRCLAFLRSVATLALVASCASVPAARAGRALGQVRTLPAQPGPHWVWVSDILLKRAALIDADGVAPRDAARRWQRHPRAAALARRSRFYQAETYYARGTRGERTDIVSITDALTLQPKGEVGDPPSAASTPRGGWLGALRRRPLLRGLQHESRDVAEHRRCRRAPLRRRDRHTRLQPRLRRGNPALPVALRQRTALVVTLDERGREASKAHTEIWFDPKADPVTEKAARRGDQWFFVSFEGVVHPVDVSGPALRFAEPWSLLSDADRKESWRVGGMQQLALHAATGRLYALMHQGGVDTHKHRARRSSSTT